MLCSLLAPRSCTESVWLCSAAQSRSFLSVSGAVVPLCSLTNPSSHCSLCPCPSCPLSCSSHPSHSPHASPALHFCAWGTSGCVCSSLAPGFSRCLSMFLVSMASGERERERDLSPVFLPPGFSQPGRFLGEWAAARLWSPTWFTLSKPMPILASKDSLSSGPCSDKPHYLVHLKH